MSATIVWFRRDLRLADNPALTAALECSDAVIPIYLAQWEEGHDWAPGEAAQWWLRCSLRRLAAGLGALGMSLQVVSGDPAVRLPELAGLAGADHVMWNGLYEPHCRRLELRVSNELNRHGVGVRVFPAALLFEPEEHLSRAGRPFVQFGAFWRSCLQLPEPRQPLPAPARRHRVPRQCSQFPSAAAPESSLDTGASGPWKPDVSVSAVSWQPGEEGAQRRLERFLDEALVDYAWARDYPGREGVSRLSPHLHFGEISPHQIWHSVRAVNRAGPEHASGAGRGTYADAGPAFLRQLGWREFAHYLLVHFPSTPTEPFRRVFADFPWEKDSEGLAAWQQGRTGYPLVDAGMRQLLAEGWMHNRVRMVVASFLTKDLLIPWQQGAAWFWDRLVDADLANNTLGWQWTAGSGPDAAPYFRIYNPTLQAERFDPGGEYVRRWQASGEAAARGVPIVDHRLARLRALAAFSGLHGRS